MPKADSDSGVGAGGGAPKLEGTAGPARVLRRPAQERARHFEIMPEGKDGEHGVHVRGKSRFRASAFIRERMTKLKTLVVVANSEGALPFDFSALERLDTLCISNTAIQTREAMPRLPTGLRRFFHDAYDLELDHPGAIADGNVFRTWDPHVFYRSFLPRDQPEWWLARFAEEHLPDPLAPS